MRRLPLLVLLYVMLDFANPLMPGAVSFEGGTIQSVQADRAGRETGAVMPALEAFQTDDLPPMERVVPPPPPARPMRHPPRRIVRGALSPHPDTASSPTDDH